MIIYVIYLKTNNKYTLNYILKIYIYKSHMFIAKLMSELFKNNKL
jgi:hypothetical protein